MKSPFTTTHDTLNEWYHIYGRKHLPWRETKDPYRIYLSEIMLQQTTVTTVLERFYFPFLERFPTLESVANASLEEVLKMWEGLGYYRRARLLHHAAVTSQGVLPSTQQELCALSGIGKTTSHAIMVFAFGARLPILDGNVKRVLCRFFALYEPKEPLLWDKAYELLDNHNPYEYNQAMMDIGSMICMATSPQCGVCPLRWQCQGQDDPLNYKPFKRKQAQPIVYQKIIVPMGGERFLLTKREGEFLHGLWGFSQIPEDQNSWNDGEKTYDVSMMQYVGNVRHVYTHFIVEASVYVCEYSVLSSMKTREEITHIPLSKIDHKALSLL